MKQKKMLRVGCLLSLEGRTIHVMECYYRIFIGLLIFRKIVFLSVATALYSLAARLDECGPQPGCEVDHVFSTAGSANMNQRSFRLNFEGNLFFFGRKIAAELEKDFLNLCKSAHEVNPESRENLLGTQRLKEAFARILAPLL